MCTCVGAYRRECEKEHHLLSFLGVFTTLVNLSFFEEKKKHHCFTTTSHVDRWHRSDYLVFFGLSRGEKWQVFLLWYCSGWLCLRWELLRFPCKVQYSTWKYCTTERHCTLLSTPRGQRRQAPDLRSPPSTILGRQYSIARCKLLYAEVTRTPRAIQCGVLYLLTRVNRNFRWL